jgi:hypothetical protein
LELEPGEALRNRIRSGRALGLLPLVEFLRRLTAARRWTPPPLRASFHFDDPNLHWRSYGHVSYAKLADHGRQHGYHAAMATVPLDAWLVYPTAARLFRERRAELSLLVHGNDHLPHELGRSMSVEAARAVAAEGLRRIARFELRSGVNVARVMAPPHGSCAESVVTGMLDVGFEAVCANMPRPWTWKAFGEHPFDAWHPGQLIGGGLPILLRRPFDDPPDDLVLRAYLDQPLIVYGHHGDLADGLRTLQDNAELINGIGDVKWGRLDEIARSNYASRRDNGRLELRMYSRHVRVPVEPEVAELCVQTPPGSDDSRLQLVVRAGGTTQTAALGETVSVDGPEVTVELRSQHHVDPGAVAAPPRRAWPVTRRAAAEARDRLQPLAAWPRQRTQRSA